MSRNLKVLGTALAAVLAMSAVVAGSASAQFEAESYPTTLTPSGNSTYVFTYASGGSQVECTKVGGSAALSSAATAMTFVPLFTNCKSSFGVAHVAMNTCDFNFTSAKSSTFVSLHVECTKAGDSITITLTDSVGASVCTLHIPAQTPGGSIEGKNIGAGTTREVEIIFSVTAISAARTGSSLCGKASSTTGTLTGIVRLTGEKPGTATHAGVFMD